jgi:hypothetical protein
MEERDKECKKETKEGAKDVKKELYYEVDEREGGSNIERKHTERNWYLKEVNRLRRKTRLC